MAAVPSVNEPLTVRMPAGVYARLSAHLFPGDNDEHGAVLEAGVSVTARGTRLLVRDVFPARDGVDYVPGTRGHRALRAEFVRDRVIHARDQKLAYLAVHNHGGGGAAAFSPVDLTSHERGYPALLDIIRNQPVGALVFAHDAVAGDIWWPGGVRKEADSLVVVGQSIRRVFPGPSPRALAVDARYDRQARMFGDAGQAILAGLRIGIIGAGGVGMLLVEYLARLGVGEIVVVDPERVDVTNLPRLPGARRRDARVGFAGPRWPAAVRRWGMRRATPKVALAERVASEAGAATLVEAMMGDVRDPGVARRFVDCDYLFLAADGDGARLVFNALVHQYLIPGVQVGSKVHVDPGTGAVESVHSVARPVLPESGCLWCNGLISPVRLAEESLSGGERRAQRYVDEPEIAAPSVITLNATAASQAANDFLFAVTGLARTDATSAYLRFKPMTREVRFDQPRQDPSCPECGLSVRSRRARGDGVRLPTRA